MKKILTVLMFATVNVFALENANILQVSEDSSNRGTAYAGSLSNESALAYSRLFTYDMGTVGMNRVTAIVNYGSATLSANTFTDGRTSSGTITVVSTGIYSTSICGTIVTVNGTRFNMGGCPPYLMTDTKVTVGASVGATAQNLCKAITNNANTMYITTCTVTAGAINLVSVAADGTAYALTTSSIPFISRGGNMGLGVETKINTTTDKIAMAAHTLTTGLPVLYTGGVALGGLTTGTTYYVLKVDTNNIRLSSSSALAQAGTYIDITSQVTDATETTYTLTPLALAGTPSFKWQMSNDNTVFVDASISSVTVSSYTNPYASVAFDFDVFNYRYLALNVTSPTTGGMYLKTDLYIKKQ